ncbi:hypothetical protein [Alteromonas halophila]|uniref:Uncharacterized protein n=1 Tax=Alteromonas halophila TaxID=516698 RepID=A0A918JNT0_9ALTE|nr:hypothetical protein [Alteromonas halophila]GGW89796.1 hypothetical protein GCM10007391_25140 [Alteromonas halophila]
MKKGIKLALFSAITVLSGSTVASEAEKVSSTSFIDEVCAFAPLVCMVSTHENGGGFEPEKPKSKKED